MEKVRATRHNGRVGKGGTFSAKHNDRSFETENAEHIDKERSDLNIYWDYVQGYNIADVNGNRPERIYNFEQIEKSFYYEHFFESVDAQNERHIASRHRERIRSVDDILKDPKTCPEETVYQLGTKDGHEDPKTFAVVAAELFEEMEKRFGDHFKILDWSLHMDESTPHIHERHVFIADDGYGFEFPKQDKACEAMGFERPYPDKKQGKNNNRKMSFDAEVRKMYIEIAEKHGIMIEQVPLEGKVHMEKNDFILARQEEQIAQNQAHLDELMLKIEDIDSMAEEVAEKAYEKACEVVTDTVQEQTTLQDISLVKSFRDEVSCPEHGLPEPQRNFVGKILNEVADIILKKTREFTLNIKRVLFSPEVKQKNQDEIKKVARGSLLEKLAEKKKEVERYKEEHKNDPKSHDRRWGAR